MYFVYQEFSIRQFNDEDNYCHESWVACLSSGIPLSHAETRKCVF